MARRIRGAGRPMPQHAGAFPQNATLRWTRGSSLRLSSAKAATCSISGADWKWTFWSSNPRCATGTAISRQEQSWPRSPHTNWRCLCTEAIWWGAPTYPSLLERERLRATCLGTLARLADAHFENANYEQALENALKLLAIDLCREDAHRMVMRAFVRLGARAQALRQYNVCRSILRYEFDAIPEPATEQLFTLIRTDPDQV